MKSCFILSCSIEYINSLLSKSSGFFTEHILTVQHFNIEGNFLHILHSWNFLYFHDTTLSRCFLCLFFFSLLFVFKIFLAAPSFLSYFPVRASQCCYSTERVPYTWENSSFLSYVISVTVIALSIYSGQTFLLSSTLTCKSK